MNVLINYSITGIYVTKILVWMLKQDMEQKVPFSKKHYIFKNTIVEGKASNIGFEGKIIPASRFLTIEVVQD